MKTLLSLSLLALVACGGSEPAKEQQPVQATLPAGLLLPDAPATAQAVESLQAWQPGQQLVLAGRVGGHEQALIPDRAVLLLSGEKSAEGCATCSSCAPAGLTKPVMVQVLDEQGRVRPVGLAGQGGLGMGSRIVVSGTVSERSTPDQLILDAQGIFVDPTA